MKPATRMNFTKDRLEMGIVFPEDLEAYQDGEAKRKAAERAQEEVETAKKYLEVIRARAEEEKKQAVAVIEEKIEMARRAVAVAEAKANQAKDLADTVHKLFLKRATENNRLFETIGINPKEDDPEKIRARLQEMNLLGPKPRIDPVTGKGLPGRPKFSKNKPKDEGKKKVA